MPEVGSDGIAGVMGRERKVKKIILKDIRQDEYDDLRNVIGPEWQFEGKIQQFMTDVTFIRRENISEIN